MNAFVLFAEQGAGGQIEQIANTFGVDWPHLIAQIISFSIVCILLYLFAYKPVLKMLAERRQLIAQGLANSEKIKAELAKTESEAAARLREQETQKAIAAAEQIMTKAHEAATQEHTLMLNDLKKEVGRLVVQTTAAVTGKVLTKDDQRRIAEETTRELSAT
jgi:F-type H+-transporting ATPase subunit b